MSNFVQSGHKLCRQVSLAQSKIQTQPLPAQGPEWKCIRSMVRGVSYRYVGLRSHYRSEYVTLEIQMLVAVQYLMACRVCQIFPCDGCSVKLSSRGVESCSIRTTYRKRGLVWRCLMIPSRNRMIGMLLSHCTIASGYGGLWSSCRSSSGGKMLLGSG